MHRDVQVSRAHGCAGATRDVVNTMRWMRSRSGWKEALEGTPQGAVISPLLASIYLHYAFDKRARQWRQRHAQGRMIVVRHADDIVLGFEHRADAEALRSA